MLIYKLINIEEIINCPNLACHERPPVIAKKIKKSINCKYSLNYLKLFLKIRKLTDEICNGLWTKEKINKPDLLRMPNC